MVLGWNSCLDLCTEDELKKWPWLIVAWLDQHNLTGCPPVGRKEPVRGRCEDPPSPDAAAAYSHWSMKATCMQMLHMHACDRGPLPLASSRTSLSPRLRAQDKFCFYY